MRRALGLALALWAGSAAAADGETGVFGLGDPLEVGVVAGPYRASYAPGTAGSPADASVVLLGVRVHAGAYTHKTLLGSGGGVEVNGVFGRALGETGFWWGQLDALANIGLVNAAASRFVVRLHLLVGVGFSLYSGTSMEGGARLALGLSEWVSLEASYLLLPTINLTLAHRAQAALAIPLIQVALGAELNFGSALPGGEHFSLVGTASWRPDFK